MTIRRVGGPRLAPRPPPAPKPGGSPTPKAPAAGKVKTAAAATARTFTGGRFQLDVDGHGTSHVKK